MISPPVWPFDFVPRAWSTHSSAEYGASTRQFLDFSPLGLFPIGEYMNIWSCRSRCMIDVVIHILRDDRNSAYAHTEVNAWQIKRYLTQLDRAVRNVNLTISLPNSRLQTEQTHQNSKWVWTSLGNCLQCGRLLSFLARVALTQKSKIKMVWTRGSSYISCHVYCSRQKLYVPEDRISILDLQCGDRRNPCLYSQWI